MEWNVNNYLLPLYPKIFSLLETHIIKQYFSNIIYLSQSKITSVSHNPLYIINVILEK